MNRMHAILLAAARLVPVARQSAPRQARDFGVGYGASRGYVRQRRYSQGSMPARFRVA